MVLFDKNRNMVIKTSILTNIPNVYRNRLRGGGEAFVLGLKDDPERKYILSTDLEMLFEECVKNYGYLVETNLEQATTVEFPYVVIGEVSEDIVLCDDGKFRLYGYSDEKPFTLFDGSSEELKDKLYGKNIVNVRNACTTRTGVLYNGEIFSDFKSFCEHIGVSHTTLGARIKRGRSLEEAVEFRRIYNYKGKFYSSLKELSKGVGVHEETLKKRIKNGMSVEEAVEAPKYQVVKNREVIAYKGRTYKMWSEFFEENPLFKHAMGSIHNSRKLGMSIEEALDDYAKKHFVKDHKGNFFRNKKERSLKYGLTPVTVHKRLKMGWSLEKALTTPTK